MITVNAPFFAFLCVMLGALAGSITTWVLIPYDRIHVTVLPEDADALTPERIERLHAITPSTRSDGA